MSGEKYTEDHWDRAFELYKFHEDLRSKRFSFFIAMNGGLVALATFLAATGGSASKGPLVAGAILGALIAVCFLLMHIRATGFVIAAKNLMQYIEGHLGDDDPKGVLLSKFVQDFADTAPYGNKPCKRCTNSGGTQKCADDKGVASFIEELEALEESEEADKEELEEADKEESEEADKEESEEADKEESEEADKEESKEAASQRQEIPGDNRYFCTRKASRCIKASIIENLIFAGFIVTWVIIAAFSYCNGGSADVTKVEIKSPIEIEMKPSKTP